MTWHEFAVLSLAIWALDSRRRWKKLAKHAIEIIGEHAKWAKERQLESRNLAAAFNAAFGGKR